MECTGRTSFLRSLSGFSYRGPALWSALCASPLWAEAAQQPRDGITPLIPLIIIFGIFYFLILRPQQKKQKLHTQFLNELKRGDVVVTSAGIIGSIRQLSERFVTLEIDDGVCLKLLRNQVAESAGNLKDETLKEKGKKE